MTFSSISTNNFTIDNRDNEGYEYNFLRDVIVCTFIFLFFGDFIEDFANYLRRQRDEDNDDNDDNDNGWLVETFLMFD